MPFHEAANNCRSSIRRLVIDHQNFRYFSLHRERIDAWCDRLLFISCRYDRGDTNRMVLVVVHDSIGACSLLDATALRYYNFIWIRSFGKSWLGAAWVSPL